jgi:hypothetical protein
VFKGAMTKPEGQLKTLHKLYDDLSQQVSRFTLIRLAILIFCVFTFSSAFHRVESGDIADTAKRIDAVGQKAYYEVQLTSVCSIQGTCVAAVPDERKLPAGCLSESQLHPPSANSTPTPTPDQIIAEEQRLHLLQSLNDKCVAAYSPTLTVLGSNVQVDLRGWIFAFPFAFLLSETYLQILRRKRRIVGSASACLLSAGAPNQQEDLPYKMVFAGDRGAFGPYARYPSQFADTLYALCAIALVVKFVVESRRAWGDYFDRDAPFFVLYAFLALVCYCFAYYRFVSKRLGSHLLQHSGIAPVLDWSDKLRAAFQKLGRLLPRRRVSLMAGTALVLSTLYFGTCMTSCGNSVPGYRLVLLKKPVVWPTFPVDWTIRSLVYYSLGLSLAAATLGLLATVISKPQVLKRPRLIEFMWIAARSVAFLALLDFASVGIPNRIGSPIGLYIVLGTWLLPLILWTIPYLRPGPEPCAKLRRYLIVIYSPAIPLSVMSTVMAVGFGYFGFIFYVLGLSFLWLGYTDLRASLEPPAIASPEVAPDVAPETIATTGSPSVALR